MDKLLFFSFFLMFLFILVRSQIQIFGFHFNPANGSLDKDIDNCDQPRGKGAPEYGDSIFSGQYQRRYE